MNPVAKAVWLIETQLGAELSLDAIAEAAGVSRFHLAHAFGYATGLSVMRYLRGRRLSEAARALAAGAPDILGVALDAGYGSHEAFTRAFREQFGVTPESVRDRRRLDHLSLMEPLTMSANTNTQLEPPRFVEGKAFLVAGLSARYTFATNQGIPLQWQRFAPHIGQIPGQVGDTTYGVCWNGDDAGNFDYVAGVEVSSFADLGDEFARVRIPAQRYVVFAHRGHASEIRDTVAAIWSRWLPSSGHRVADAPNFERYGPEFDPKTGSGLVEFWIPLAS